MKFSKPETFFATLNCCPVKVIIISYLFVALERTALQLISDSTIVTDEDSNNVNNPFIGANQIQIQESIEELKLKAETEKFNKMMNLNENIQDLHGMYEDLNRMVVEQKESVDVIEENVENAQEDVNRGTRTLMKICKQVLAFLILILSMM